MAVLVVKEQEFAVLPDDTIIGVTVESVDVRTIERRDGSGSFDKLDFKFKIDSIPSALEGEYGFMVGGNIWGNTGTNLTSHPDNKIRQWAEALLDIGPLENGFALDTDNLVGLSAKAIVSSYDGKSGKRNQVGALLSNGSPIAAPAAQKETLPVATAADDDPGF